METSVSTAGTEVRYFTGDVVYVEDLVGGKWVGRYWSSDGRVEPGSFWASSAFDFSVRYTPSDPPCEVPAEWELQSCDKPAETERGGLHSVVRLRNEKAGFDVYVHTLLDGTPTLVRWLEITNAGDKPAALEDVHPWCGRLWAEGDRFRLGHSLKKEIQWEGWFGWDGLAHGVTAIRNVTGKLFDEPYFVLHNETVGEYFFGQLGWPVCYNMEFVHDGGLSFKLGPAAETPLWVIAPGETISTPAVHLSCVKGDFDAAVQAMHAHIRKSVSPARPGDKEFLIQYLMPDDWPMSCYTGDDSTEANQKKLVDVAAAVGMEVYILDGPRWCSGYGNWLVPRRDLYPDGLDPLVDHAHGKGLLFGLYTETEGGRDGDSPNLGGWKFIGKWSDSQVYRDHPDWFETINLNLAIPEAAEYYKAELARIAEFYHLDLHRHDSNGIGFTDGGAGAGTTERFGFTESNYWRHYKAFYEAFDSLHEKHPSLILQQAAAGNYRLDLATVGRFHEHFTSDRATYPWSQRMLSGISVWLPPEVLVNSNGMALPKDLPDPDTTLRGAYCLGNTPMIFNAFLPKSLDELTPEFRDKCLHYANIYKSFIRPMLADCLVWHHAPVNATGGVETGDWFAMEFTSPDCTKGWATIIRLSEDAQGAYLLKPRGLDSGKKYRVTFDNTGLVQAIDGSKLAREGLEVSPSGASCSEFIMFEAVD